jgi:DNA modification methylase
MEIDARYCDATIRRWQAYTGKQAALDSDGKPFQAIERKRLRVAA